MYNEVQGNCASSKMIIEVLNNQESISAGPFVLLTTIDKQCKRWGTLALIPNLDDHNIPLTSLNKS